MDPLAAGWRKIVLLYNDRDRGIVDDVYDRLVPRLSRHRIRPWQASRDMSAFGNLFDNIEDAIADALGAVMFLGPHGLGRFQDNIERGAVQTEQWQQGARYGALLVHLSGGLAVPRPLLRWASVNHDGALQAPAQLADAIVQRFGLAVAA